VEVLEVLWKSTEEVQEVPGSPEVLLEVQSPAATAPGAALGNLVLWTVWSLDRAGLLECVSSSLLSIK
jgi:hypothetical protein